MEKIAKKEVEKLLEEIGVTGSVEVTMQDDALHCVIDSSDNALLIGKHGSTLYALELILSLIIARKQGEFHRVILEIGGYRKEREEYLEQLATRLKEDVLSQGVEKSLHGLRPWERRFVHLFLKDDPEVMTESEGEDDDRILVIKKK